MWTPSDLPLFSKSSPDQRRDIILFGRDFNLTLKGHINAVALLVRTSGLRYRRWLRCGCGMLQSILKRSFGGTQQIRQNYCFPFGGNMALSSPLTPPTKPGPPLWVALIYLLARANIPVVKNELHPTTTTEIGFEDGLPTPLHPLETKRNIERIPSLILAALTRPNFSIPKPAPLAAFPGTNCLL